MFLWFSILKIFEKTFFQKSFIFNKKKYKIIFYIFFYKFKIITLKIFNRIIVY